MTPINNQYYQRYLLKLFPTKEQALLIEEYIKINDFIYNWGLNLEELQYEKYIQGIDKNSYISLYDLQRLLVQYRQEDKHIASFPIEIERGALRRLDHAFKVYMDHSIPNNHPRYKTVYNSSNSFALRSDRFYIDHDGCRLDGLPRFELIYLGYDTGLDRSINFINPVISKDSINQYWIGFSIVKAKPILTIPQTDPIAIDINARGNARLVLSNGKRYTNPINFENAIRNINNSQRELSYYYQREREWKALHPNELYTKSNNELRIEEIFHKRYIKLTNITQSFYLEAIKDIINTNPKAIIIEDLDVLRMLKTPYIADDISHACFGYFKQIIKYECDKYNIPLLLVPSDFKSSKICSKCGHYESEFKSQLVFKCGNCGYTIDRDDNASINLLHYYNLDEY